MSTAPGPHPIDRIHSQVFREQTLDLSNRAFTRALFDRCQIKRMAGARLFNCTFENSKLETEDVRDVIGSTVTLNCATFDGIRLSDEVLNALVYLITRGATAEQQVRIRAALPPERCRSYARLFPLLETR